MEETAKSRGRWGSIVNKANLVTTRGQMSGGGEGTHREDTASRLSDEGEDAPHIETRARLKACVGGGAGGHNGLGWGLMRGEVLADTSVPRPVKGRSAGDGAGWRKGLGATPLEVTAQNE